MNDFDPGDMTSYPASVMCTLCGAVDVVETNPARFVEYVISAGAWASHMGAEHSDIVKPGHASDYVVMVEHGPKQ